MTSCHLRVQLLLSSKKTTKCSCSFIQAKTKSLYFQKSEKVSAFLPSQRLTKVQVGRMKYENTKWQFFFEQNKQSILGRIKTGLRLSQEFGQTQLLRQHQWVLQFAMPMSVIKLALPPPSKTTSLSSNRTQDIYFHLKSQFQKVISKSGRQAKH